MMKATSDDTNRKVDVITMKMVRKEPFMVKEGPITNKDRAISVLSEQIGERDQEVFVVLCLDSKGKPNSYSEVHVGTLNSALVHPREIFKTAILSNASAIIIGHNHPSGDLSPSRQDMRITEELVNSGKILDIEVHDHIIVSGKDGVSIRERQTELFKH